jgi:hypothetical protein
MNKFSLVSAVKLLCLSLAVCLLSACAGNPARNQTVEQRAMTYWNAAINGEYAVAYEVLSPGYRSSVSLNAFQTKMLLKKVKWTDAQYIEGDCTDTTCKVKISLDYTVFGAVPGVQSFSGKQTIDENWVLVDRVWYLVPER